MAVNRFLSLSAGMLMACAVQTCSAAFIISADTGDLRFNGPSTISVDFILTHDGVGPSTFSNFTFRFGEVGDSNSGGDPAGLSFVGATLNENIGLAGYPLGGAFVNFVFAPDNNQVTMVNTAPTAAFANADLGPGGSDVLFTLDIEVDGTQTSYEFEGFVFEAFRGGLDASFTEISDDWSFPGGLRTGTILVTAIPEPGSMLALGGLAAIGALRMRRRKAAKAA